ncbi:MAG: TonB-dependent receptor [Gemmatimonadales bacterium]|nr:TonB-dependent receptor [Gemmatimonadales bacterium]
MRGATAAVLALLLTGLGRPVEAQVLRGRLRDVDTNAPIAGGVMTLIGENGARLVSFVTGENGDYRLQAPGPGTYLIEARRLGYRLWIDGPVELRSGDDWETEYHLRAIPVQLDPVEVTAEATRYDPYLQQVGFFERQRSDFGHFVTREDIAARAPQKVTDVLISIPGVRLVPGAGGLGRSAIELRGSLLSYGGVCHPRVFIDGLMVIRGDARPRGQDIYGMPEEGLMGDARGDPAERMEIALDDVVMPDDIQGMEVYRSAAQVPVRFGGTSTETQCGVIVIWTRTGRRTANP